MDSTIYVAKTNALTFVFAYEKNRFSHDTAHTKVSLLKENKIEPRHEKTNVLVSDLVWRKPGCTATEDG